MHRLVEQILDTVCNPGKSVTLINVSVIVPGHIVVGVLVTHRYKAPPSCGGRQIGSD